MYGKSGAMQVAIAYEWRNKIKGYMIMCLLYNSFSDRSKVTYHVISKGLMLMVSVMNILMVLRLLRNS